MRIGSFGAIRPLKNQISAAAAALTMAESLRTPLEFWISTEREEGGNFVLGSIEALFAGEEHRAKLVKVPWKSWPEFRPIVRMMHLLIYVSHTESFSMVTADGIAEGVASVVSSAIDWAPKDWVADMDDVACVAHVGRHLLTDHEAVADGLAALKRHNAAGVVAWQALDRW